MKFKDSLCKLHNILETPMFTSSSGSIKSKTGEKSGPVCCVGTALKY